MLSFFVRLSPRPPPPIRYPFPLIGSFDPISADLIRSFELFFAARFAISINRCVSHTTIFLGTYLCELARAYRSLPSVRKPARNRVQPSVYRPTLAAFLFAWHHDVRHLQRWRWTRQRKHLVHSDAGPDCSIAQARFANLL